MTAPVVDTLTPTEEAIYGVLVAHADDWLPRDELARLAYEGFYAAIANVAAGNLLHVHLSHMRRKGVSISNWRGHGVRLGDHQPPAIQRLATKQCRRCGARQVFPHCSRKNGVAFAVMRAAGWAFRPRARPWGGWFCPACHPLRLVAMFPNERAYIVAERTGLRIGTVHRIRRQLREGA